MDNQTVKRISYTNFKSELEPILMDDRENTPLRDEMECSTEPAVEDVCVAGWHSDDGKGAAALEPPSPPSMNPVRVKRSPKFDDQATPPRVSNTDESDEPDLVTGSMPATFKKEEPADLQLDFLDALCDVDFQGLASMENQTDSLVKIETKVPRNELEDEEDDDEMQQLTLVHKQLLKQLERKNLEKAKKKKHKKEKKHKRHRSRSASPSPSQISEHSKKQRRLNESSRNNVPTRDVKADPDELDYVPVKDCEKSIKIININKLMQDVTAAGAPAPTLSVKEKRNLAVERVKAVLKLCHLKSSKTPATEFLVVDTIRKLPSLLSVLSSASFENPSPLSNNFNVSYKFNSTTKSNINISKWGLEPMPDVTTKLLRLTGIDVTRLMELQMNSKMSLHRMRLKQEEENEVVQTEDDCVSTGLYRSLSTQTDGRIGGNSRDVAVQTMPVSHTGIFWLDSRFSESDVSQQHANVMFALKELCATVPSSSFWADALYKALHSALKIKREEVKHLDMKRTLR